MKQPEQIYKVDHTAENIKIIEDYTAEKCLYYIQKHCIKHADRFDCTFLYCDTDSVKYHKTINDHMNGG